MAISDVSNPVERELATRAVDALLAAKLSISVWDGEAFALRRSTDRAAILAALGTTDDDRLYAYSNGVRLGSVWLIWGNDCDLLSDWSESLDRIIEPLLDAPPISHQRTARAERAGAARTRIGNRY